MSDRSLSCLRCGADMRYIQTQKLQFGEAGLLLGILPNLLAGAVEVDIYTCPDCARLEFFLSDSSGKAEDRIAQTVCPNCGKRHDIDYHMCPFCKYDYLQRSR